MKSAYIHIPFCKQKCLYCDFNSFANKQDVVQSYIDALKKEIQTYTLPDTLDTIYIGGGTPSFIDENFISEILNLLPASKDITIEVNPGTVTLQKFIAYKNMGITRVSIGLQSHDDNILKTIGRIHTKEEFQKAFMWAREAGFDDINVDLMFGLPNQTLEIFKESIEYVISLNPTHISSYSLILHSDIFKNLPGEEVEREMYHLLVSKLKDAGYVHYEISNFAKAGYESKHNLAYWHQDEYYGFGAGASGFLDGKRYTNIGGLSEYIAKINDGVSVANIEEVLDDKSRLDEYMMLGLRLIDGINVCDTNNKFDVDILEIYKDSLDKLKRFGLIQVDQNIKLTMRGLDLANCVWEEFV